MTKPFQALTDDALAILVSEGDIGTLATRYRELRDHHLAETATRARPDRSTILRMAGNIAGNLYADPTFEGSASEVAVEIARLIVAEVDR